MIIQYIILGVLAAFGLYVLFLIVCGFFVDTGKEYEKHSNFYRSLLNSATAIGLPILRIHVHTSGIEKIPYDTKKLLFVSNHRSNFDPIITWYVLRHWKPAFISKKENFDIPIFGRIIRKCCFMAIDRENPRNAIKTIYKAAELLKREEVSIGIYPEGTRSKSGVLLPFHNGVFKIAQRADAPIVVLSLDGTEKIHKNFPLHHTDVYFDVLEIIPASEVVQEKTDLIGTEVKSCMESQLSKDIKLAG